MVGTLRVWENGKFVGSSMGILDNSVIPITEYSFI